MCSSIQKVQLELSKKLKNNGDLEDDKFSCFRCALKNTKEGENLRRSIEEVKYYDMDELQGVENICMINESIESDEKLSMYVRDIGQIYEIG